MQQTYNILFDQLVAWAFYIFVKFVSYSRGNEVHVINVEGIEFQMNKSDDKSINLTVIV
jgi:hypothetical protein